MSRGLPHGWRPVLRIAAREARRSPGRSALVVALLALPIVAIGAGDVLGRTMQLSTREKVERTFAGAAAIATPFGGHVTQSPDAQFVGTNGSTPNTSMPGSATLLAHLPAGSRLIEDNDSSMEVRGPYGIRSIPVSDLAYSDPAIAPLSHQRSGRAPRRAGEIALTVNLARSLGVRVGGRLDTLHPVGRLTVVGILGNAYERRDQTGYLAPGQLASAAAHDDARWFIVTPHAVSWAQVLALNQVGFAIRSAGVELDPPPHSQIPAYSQYSGGGAQDEQTISAIGLLGGMVVLEIILLAGPAFAVGARRSRHSLGLISAVGATRRDLRNTVLATGLVLGTSAGVVGLVGGITLGLDCCRSPRTSTIRCQATSICACRNSAGWSRPAS